MIKTGTFILDNGVRVVYSNDNTKNQSYAEIYVNYGSRITDFLYLNKKYKIKEGLAHLLEHSIVESSLFGNLIDYYKDKYVVFNAITSSKHTSFFFDTVLDFNEHLKELIMIVNKPVFDDIKLEEIKKPIIEEIKRTSDRPYKKVSEKINNCIYTNKQVETVGTKQSVMSITIDDLKLIHQLFYQPNNQTIYICGKFDLDEVTNIINDTYKELNIKKQEYKIIRKHEKKKVTHKKAKVYDNEFESYINISFKVDISKLTPKEKVKGTFYLQHFLDYNFSDTSKTYLELINNNDTVYSIDRGLNCNLENFYIIDVGLYGKNVKHFKKLVMDVVNNKYSDKEMFELWKKRQIIDMIMREQYPMQKGNTFLDNVLTFNYLKEDTLEDIENFSIKDYQNFLNKLEFKNYAIVIQKRK